MHSFSSALEATHSLEAHASVDMGANYSRSSPVTTEPGLNRFVWDLRHPGATGIADGVIFWHPPKTPPVGPLALPGEYKVQMEVDGQIQTKALTIKADPRISFPVEELQKQFDLHIKIRSTLSEISEAVLSIRRVNDQIDNIRSKSAHIKDAKGIVKDLGQIQDKLMTVEYALTEPRMEGASDSFHFPTRLDNQFIILVGTIANSDRAPTQQSYEVYKVLKERAMEQLDIMKTSFEAIQRHDRKLSRLGLPPLFP